MYVRSSRTRTESVKYKYSKLGIDQYWNTSTRFKYFITARHHQTYDLRTRNLFKIYFEN